MKLYYHKGRNFGDQLNPMIFDYFLPNTFNENDPDLFVGVGSLIGLVSRFPQKKLIFSSGLADGDAGTYGPVPQNLSTYEFLCVRGPLTAKRLNLDPTLAITDGAILLAAMDLPLVRSYEVISFMPHAGSELFYDHQKMADELGWQLISPSEEPMQVLQKMMRSKLIITEAMHGAIVADTLRIPWIPYSGFSTINHFKWSDWCLSMDLKYEPIQLKPFFSNDFSERLIQENLSKKGLVKNKGLVRILEYAVRWKMDKRWKSNVATLKAAAKLSDAFMSKDEVFNDRLGRMMKKLHEVKEMIK